MQEHWIDGKWHPSSSDEGLAVVNPATEAILDHIPVGTAADVAAAVTAAKRAGRAWAGLGPTGRRPLLEQAAERIRAQADAIARVLTAENGKPLGQARAEVMGAASWLSEFAELAVHYRVGSQSAPADELVFQRWEPRGVAACIVPWNFPLQVAMETLAPNLAVGNTVVIKPSEKTPLSLTLMVSTAFDHLPAGVLNLVLGDGPHAGEALIQHEDVDVVMFVGSVRTGRHIGEVSGATTRKAILELGGKDAFIVDEDVNIVAAARLVADSCFANSGQICTSTERVFVHERIVDEFIDALRAATDVYHLGDGTDEGVDLGPLVDHLQLETVERHVADAVAQGAKVVAGGERLPRPGYFYPPTIMLLPAQDQSLLMRQETFGPVAPVVPFATFDEAIAMANDSAYGLAAVVYSNNANHVMQAIDSLQAGMVKVNTRRGKAPGATSEPFGVSGLGHGYGMEVLAELTRQKSVQWRKMPLA